MPMYTPSQFCREVLDDTVHPITIRRWCENGAIIGYKGVNRVEKTPTGRWIICTTDTVPQSKIDGLVKMMKEKAA